MPWNCPKPSVQPQVMATMASVITQIILLDIVFSLDSVITAIGMAQRVEVMMAAIIIAIFVMLLGSGAISGFIHQHPSVKILALSFLLLIGVTLIAEGFTLHIPKGYIYFAMGFSGAVETINLMSGHRRALQRQASLGHDDVLIYKPVETSQRNQALAILRERRHRRIKYF